jgi:hypothetical protein
MATLIKGLGREKHIVVLIGNLIKVIFLTGCQFEHSIKRDKNTKKGQFRWSRLNQIDHTEEKMHSLNYLLLHRKIIGRQVLIE